MLHKNKSLWLIYVILIAYLSLQVVVPAPAFASIHKYPESPTQIMYRSVQSLRDTRGRAWQVVLYKRVRSGLANSLTLRLVGFPGTELAPTVPLTITAGTGQVWTAQERAVRSPLPTNVREYDFQAVVAQLGGTPPLRLHLPVKGESEVEAIVPTFAVREWILLWKQGT